MKRGQLGVVSFVMVVLTACGGSGTPSHGVAPGASSSAPSSAHADAVFDVPGIKALLAARAVAARRARTALVAPHPGVRAGSETLLPALGPCVRPTPAETKSMEKRILAWVDREVPTPEDGREKETEISPIAWGCVEPRGTVARVRYQYNGACSDGRALLRVGKTVEELASVSGTGDDCATHGAFHDVLTVIAMLDVDGDGTVEPLVMRNRHEQTEPGRVWIFVAGLTPQPHLELHERHVDRSPDVQLVATERGRMLHVAPPDRSPPSEHEGLFLEVLPSGVVTEATPSATSRSASLRAQDEVIAEVTAYGDSSPGETHGPGERAFARDALRTAGVDEAAILGVLGPESPAEARERLLSFAWEAHEKAEDALGTTRGEQVCDVPHVAPETPWQIPAWGRCVLPSRATRDRVEPAIADWVKKRSVAVLRKWLPGETRLTAPERDEVVARWGCEHAGSFFVQLDGGGTWKVSALLAWSGKELTEVSSVGGERCEDWCESAPDRDLDVALTDLDGDGDVEAIVRAHDGCADSPANERELHKCTRTEVHGLGPPRHAKLPAAYSREDPKTYVTICRVGDAVHLLGQKEDQDGTSDVLAVAGAAGLSPAVGVSPYQARRAELVARRDAAELILESARAEGPPPDPGRLRAALRLLGVPAADITTFLAP